MKIRWMVRGDLDRVMQIEAESFEFPWSRAEMIRQLQHRTVIGQVAEEGYGICGYMVYDIGDPGSRRVELLNIAVDRHCRLQGLGRAMAMRLIARLDVQLPKPRRRIIADVRERNLAAQLFFKSLGFIATKMIPDYYDETEEDAIRFERRYIHPKSTPSMFAEFAPGKGNTR